MKIKKKAAAAAVAFAAAMNLSACYDPNDNINDCAYGPPPETWEYEETDTEIVSNDDTTRTETEISYDPADNINEDVYGPPIDE